MFTEVRIAGELVSLCAPSVSSSLRNMWAKGWLVGRTRLSSMVRILGLSGKRPSLVKVLFFFIFYLKPRVRVGAPCESVRPVERWGQEPWRKLWPLWHQAEETEVILSLGSHELRVPVGLATPTCLFWQSCILLCSSQNGSPRSGGEKSVHANDNDYYLLLLCYTPTQLWWLTFFYSSHF